MALRLADYGRSSGQGLPEELEQAARGIGMERQADIDEVLMGCTGKTKGVKLEHHRSTNSEDRE